MLALFVCPVLVHVTRDKSGVDLVEGASDILGKGKIFFPASCIQIIIKNAAHAAWFAAMGKEEIFITPCLKLRVI